MTKVSIIRTVPRLYFVAALTLSFIHLVHAGHKGGLAWEAWTIPFMVDGIAIMGLTMRSTDFASRTRKIGFRTQCIAGALSLSGNVYAAHNIGTGVFGVAVVALFVFSEWITDQIESAAVEEARTIAQEAADRKAAAIKKAQTTRRRNAKRKATETQALENLLKV